MTQRGLMAGVIVLPACAVWLGGIDTPQPASAANLLHAPADIIVAFAEDPNRTLAAARLHRQRPGSVLLIQGSRSLLELSERRLKAARLWPEPPPRLLELGGTCDTVGQLSELARLLERSFRPGRLTVVTSRSHLHRSVAIARTLTAHRGWTVAGQPVDAGFVAPQHPLSTPRDVLRALLWRLTGWHGRFSQCRQHPLDGGRRPAKPGPSPVLPAS
jgi:uncharacterized SAM-binding protein YcdF (DUF218 family)